jgi:hypothetical protein
MEPIGVGVLMGRGYADDMAREGEEILNPVTGERIVFVCTSADTGGELLEFTSQGPPSAHSC